MAPTDNAERDGVGAVELFQVKGADEVQANLVVISFFPPPLPQFPLSLLGERVTGPLSRIPLDICRVGRMVWHILLGWWILVLRWRDRLRQKVAVCGGGWMPGTGVG